MPIIHVKPAPDKQIRNPDAGFAPLPPAGDSVMDSAYWRMHARNGDVTIGAPPAPPAPRAAKRVPPSSANE